MPNAEITEEGRRGDVYGKSQVQGPDVTSVSPPSRVAASREGRNSLRPVSTISVGYRVKSLRGT